MWASDGAGYSPPPDEDGTLRRLPDGFDYPNAAGNATVHAPSGFELADDDGYLYQFGESGQLLMVTAPTDAVNPGALRYIYSTLSGTDVQRLTQIRDVFGRAVDLTYKDPSSANCPTAGGSSQPAISMLCQVTYSGFTRNSTGAAPTTDLLYDTSGNLTAVINPGDTATGAIRPRTDFAYASDGSGRVVGVRDASTNDLVAASVFTSANTPSTDPLCGPSRTARARPMRWSPS